MQRSLNGLAELTGTRLQGDAELMISGVNSLDEAAPGEISFLANKKYAKLLEQSRAGAVVIPEGVVTSKAALVSKNPYADFVKILTLFAPPIPLPEPGIHPTALVDPTAQLAEEVAIGPYCVIGPGVVIGRGSKVVAQAFIAPHCVLGEDCILYPQVVIRERCRLGNRVILNPGVVIGGDGFGFAPDQGRYHKIPQIGIVVIEDDVEIGSNTTIDRAALNETRIGEGTKIDNLVMVAHNVIIGRHTVIAGQAGLSGSAKVGDHVMLGGQAGIAGHLTIGDKVVVGGQSGVSKNIPAGQFMDGTPARPFRTNMREQAELGRIGDLRKKIHDLEKRLEALENHEK